MPWMTGGASCKLTLAEEDEDGALAADFQIARLPQPLVFASKDLF